MGFLGGKSKEELFNELRKELDELRLQLEEKMDRRIDRVEASLNEAIHGIRQLIEQKSYPEEFLIRMNEAVKITNSLIGELKVVREYRDWFNSIKDGLNDILEVLSRERAVIKEEVDRIIKDRSELESIKNELMRWKADAEEKEMRLASFSEHIRQLEEKKNRLENEIKELSQRYLLMFEDMLHKLDEEISKIDRMFKLKEFRLERIVKKERELSEALIRIKEREAQLKDLEAKLQQMSEEVSALELKKKELMKEIDELTDRKNSLEKMVGELRRAILYP